MQRKRKRYGQDQTGHLWTPKKWRNNNYRQSSFMYTDRDHNNNTTLIAGSDSSSGTYSTDQTTECNSYQFEDTGFDIHGFDLPQESLHERCEYYLCAVCLPLAFVVVLVKQILVLSMENLLGILFGLVCITAGVWMLLYFFLAGGCSICIMTISLKRSPFNNTNICACTYLLVAIKCCSRAPLGFQDENFQ